MNFISIRMEELYISIISKLKLLNVKCQVSNILHACKYHGKQSYMTAQHRTLNGNGCLTVIKIIINALCKKFNYSIVTSTAYCMVRLNTTKVVYAH